MAKAASIDCRAAPIRCHSKCPERHILLRIGSHLPLTLLDLLKLSPSTPLQPQARPTWKSHGVYRGSAVLMPRLRDPIQDDLSGMHPSSTSQHEPVKQILGLNAIMCPRTFYHCKSISYLERSEMHFCWPNKKDLGACMPAHHGMSVCLSVCLSVSLPVCIFIHTHIV